MPQTENRLPRLGIRPRSTTKPPAPHVTLRAPKSKPLNGTKSPGNIARATPQMVGSLPKGSEVAATNPLHGKTSAPFAPVPIPRSKRSEQRTCNDTNRDNEEGNDENERMRSTLISTGTPRKMKTAGSDNSVSRGPAIISCGPVTSEQSTPSVYLEPVLLSPKRQGGNLTQAVKTLLHLKKGEQEELLKLLQLLNPADVDDEYTDKPKPKQTRSEPVPELRFNDTRKLNPEAPAFRDFSGMKRRISDSKIPLGRDFHSLATPRKCAQMPLVKTANHKDPDWPDIFNPPISDNSSNDALAPQAAQRDVETHDSSIPRLNFSQPILVAIPVIETPYGFQISHQQPMWSSTLGFQPHPLVAPQAPHIVRRLPNNVRRVKGPLIDISSQFVPPEEGPGRTAHAHTIDENWGQSLLDKFTAKYPRTGKMKGPVSAPGKMRQAAAIQQQLEFLLYREKERGAFEGRVGNLQRRNLERGSGSGTSSNEHEDLVPEELLGSEICPSVNQVLQEIAPLIVIG